MRLLFFTLIAIPFLVSAATVNNAVYATKTYFADTFKLGNSGCNIYGVQKGQCLGWILQNTGPYISLSPSELETLRAFGEKVAARPNNNHAVCDFYIRWSVPVGNPWGGPAALSFLGGAGQITGGFTYQDSYLGYQSAMARDYLHGDPDLCERRINEWGDTWGRLVNLNIMSANPAILPSPLTLSPLQICFEVKYAEEYQSVMQILTRSCQLLNTVYSPDPNLCAVDLPSVLDHGVLASSSAQNNEASVIGTVQCDRESSVQISLVGRYANTYFPLGTGLETDISFCEPKTGKCSSLQDPSLQLSVNGSEPTSFRMTSRLISVKPPAGEYEGFIPVLALYN